MSFSKNAIMCKRNIDQFGQYLLYISNNLKCCILFSSKLENLLIEYFVRTTTIPKELKK